MPGEAVEPQTQVAAPPVIGYFGKVPVKGDFVQRKLPRDFVDPWDHWLQHAMATSKGHLGDAWLDSYLTSPVWNFGLSAGLAGAHPAIGLIMPSVDSVGRYFPMTFAALVPGAGDPFSLSSRAPAWFVAAEDAALSCLETGFELEMLDEHLTVLEGILAAGVDPAVQLSHAAPSPSGGVAFQMSAGVPERLFPDGYAGLLDRFAQTRFEKFSLWWTAGSDRVPPSIRMFPGLPADSDFGAFLSAAAI